MFWIIDILVLLLLGIAIITGLKKGFFNTSYEIIGNLIVLAVSLALTVLGVWFFYKVNTVDQMTIYFVKLIGETNAFFDLIGITSQKIGNILSIAVIAICCFVVFYIIVLFLHKKFLKLMNYCRTNMAFKIVDSTLGVVINTAICLALVLGVFGFIHAFNDTSIFTAADEVLRACPVSGLIYEYNPINSVIADTGVADKITDLINANFN